MSETAMHRSRLAGWGMFLFLSFLVWIFGWIIGPYFETAIPTYRKMTQLVEERGIDSAAYMYVEKTGSYDGEYYLTDSFKHSKRDDYGMTLSFFAGVILCFVILWIGWRYVM